MGDWSKGIAAGLREKREQARQESQALTERRKLREDKAPMLWMMLCESIKSECIQIDGEMGEDVLRANDSQDGKIIVRFTMDGRSRTLTIKFIVSSAENALTWDVPRGTSGGSSGAYSLSVSGENVFLESATLGHQTPQEISHLMLEQLLKD